MSIKATNWMPTDGEEPTIGKLLTSKLLVDPPEAARLLSISERTLATLTAQGVIPSVKISHARRYSPMALAAWIQEQEVKSTPARSTMPMTATA